LESECFPSSRIQVLMFVGSRQSAALQLCDVRGLDRQM
jgi:hypothetical protein